MGQGTCQAIEDDGVLADRRRDAADIPSAFRTSEARRLPHTRRVVRESRADGRIARWSNPLARRFREAPPSSRSVARVQAEPLHWMTTPQRVTHLNPLHLAAASYRIAS